MGPNAWQSEIFKVFTYPSFSRKRPFCNWTKFRQRNTRNRISEFPIILYFRVLGWRWAKYVKVRKQVTNFILFFACSLSLLIGCCEATVTQHGREAIYLRMFRKFSSIDARNRWYASVSIRKWRDEGTYARNNNGLSVWNNFSWDNLSSHLFLCNLDGGVKVLKLLCGVCGRKWSSKSKRLCKRLRVLSYDCIIIILKLLNSNNTSNNGFILHFHKVALHLWNTSP